MSRRFKTAILTQKTQHFRKWTLPATVLDNTLKLLDSELDIELEEDQCYRKFVHTAPLYAYICHKFSIKPETVEFATDAGKFRRKAGNLWDMHPFDVAFRIIFNLGSSEEYKFLDGNKKGAASVKLQKGEFTIMGSSMNVSPYSIGVSKIPKLRPSSYMRYTVIIDVKVPGFEIGEFYEAIDSENFKLPTEMSETEIADVAAKVKSMGMDIDYEHIPNVVSTLIKESVA